MSTTITKIGPDDHGRPMTLDDFEVAEGQEGFLYELSRGVVVVNQVPNLRHLWQVNEIRRQLSAQELAHPGQILCIAAGSDCKILLQELQSERHPDLAIYKTSPPDVENPWASWIPEIVIEVVSPSSVQRDYVEKRDEYLQFGVQEYWIIDADKRQMLVLRRSKGTWSEIKVVPSDIFQTHLLPDLEFDCQAVFAAAELK